MKIVPRRRLHHALHHSMDCIHHPLGVDVDHLIPFFRRLAANIRQTGDAGVDKHHINWPVRGLAVGDSFGDLTRAVARLLSLQPR